MRYTLASILIAGVVTIPAPAMPDPIVAIDTAYATDYYRDALLSHGFRGIAGDGGEYIYVPQSAAIALCGSDTDCEMALEQTE